MAYLGNQPALSYTSFAKQDFTTSATTSYTLDHPVTNENEIALFINFVRQEPTTAYTASGTSLTLTSATSATDDMYCVFLGKAVQTVNPPNGSVGASQIADSSIALGKLSATGTKDSTTFLRGDNTFAEVPAGGITEADQFRLTANLSSDADPISSNLERVDDATFSKIGTGMTLSSGVYTFPSTGLYYVVMNARVNHTSGDTIVISMNVSSDSGSNYDTVSEISFYQTANDHLGTNNAFVNVTNASTFRIKFIAGSFTSASINGNTNLNKTSFTFIRLGDSQ